MPSLDVVPTTLELDNNRERLPVTLTFKLDIVRVTLNRLTKYLEPDLQNISS